MEKISKTQYSQVLTTRSIHKAQGKRHVQVPQHIDVISARRFSSPTFEKSSIYQKGNPTHTLPFTRFRMHVYRVERVVWTSKVIH